VLIDSPRFNAPLRERLEQLGGVAWMLLTHIDDVGDHARFAERFGCQRVIHAADADGDTRSVEVVLEGDEPRELDRDLLAIPTPGHTRGSTCFLFANQYLFTGDHLAWSPSRGHVYAFRSACWFDWSVQTASMERLARHDFTWILPGHGRRAHFELPQMREQMQRCIEWMKRR
jgi:glyoxylase-like metal-dependent hydrolase (beta-lactamase superfamily II)